MVQAFPVDPLISSLFEIPLILEDRFGVMPSPKLTLTNLSPGGFITETILDIVLLETIEKVFPILYPGIRYYRVGSKVLIGTSKLDPTFFDFHDAGKLLDQFQLSGYILYIRFGEAREIPFHQMHLTINYEGRIEASKASDPANPKAVNEDSRDKLWKGILKEIQDEWKKKR